MNTRYLALLIFPMMLMLSLSSCRDDGFDNDPRLKLEFSVDTLMFDTVFTQVGSSTRMFKIYNRHSSRLNISSVRLASGSESFFRINLDGRSGLAFQNVEIGPRDSLFVFVEVKIDPLQEDNPMIIADSLVFEINQNIQDVKLVAWGQDADFYYPNYYDAENDLSYHLLTEPTTWSGPRPVVIYGLLVVAPDVPLTMEPGTRVHLHNRSAMIFLERSSLKVMGSLEDPVHIQGDRPEPFYRELPGQWGYIWLTATSKDHEINHALIKNGTYGIVLDSIGSNTDPTLRLRNTIIRNMEHTGLEFNGSWVQAENVVVANCRRHALVMQLGGDYEFLHLSIANYYSLAIRQSPSLVFNNYYRDALGQLHVRPFSRAYFGNSIIYGSLQEELGLDYYPNADVANFFFENSLVRTSLTRHAALFQDCIINQMPRFADVSKQDYRLQAESPAIGKGLQAIALRVPFDIAGEGRGLRVDMGAYQFVESEREK